LVDIVFCFIIAFKL